MSVHTIHQSKKGITLVDGFYLVRNPRTQTKSVISITNDIVYVHDISRKMSLQDLINLQLRRDGVEKIFEEPYFSDFAVGMFVRVSLGKRDDGTVAYRVCQVKKIIDFIRITQRKNKRYFNDSFNKFFYHNKVTRRAYGKHF